MNGVRVGVFQILFVGLVVLLTCQVQAASTCSKDLAEKKVQEICDQISKKGKEVQKTWPAGLVYENCGENNLWVQDTNPDLTIVAHPKKPKVQGKAAKEFKDSTGRWIFREFALMADFQPGGAWIVYDYENVKNSVREIRYGFVRKCSYKNEFSWVVGTSITSKFTIKNGGDKQ